MRKFYVVSMEYEYCCCRMQYSRAFLCKIIAEQFICAQKCMESRHYIQI